MEAVAIRGAGGAGAGGVHPFAVENVNPFAVEVVGMDSFSLSLSFSFSFSFSQDIVFERYSQTTVRAHSEHIQITFRAHSDHAICSTFCISYSKRILIDKE